MRRYLQIMLLKRLTLNIIYQEVPTKITVRSSGSKPVPQSAVSSVTTAVRFLKYFILRTLSHSTVEYYGNLFAMVFTLDSVFCPFVTRLIVSLHVLSTILFSSFLASFPCSVLSLSLVLSSVNVTCYSFHLSTMPWHLSFQGLISVSVLLTCTMIHVSLFNHKWCTRTGWKSKGGDVSYFCRGEVSRLSGKIPRGVPYCSFYRIFINNF